MIPAFTATGIGSIPHTKPTAALELITKYFQVIPHWPQLPKLSPEEGLIGQNTALLNKIGMIINDGHRAPYFNTDQEDWAEKLTVFYSYYLEAFENKAPALQEFAYPEKYAAGLYSFLEHFNPNLYPQARFIKGQVTGPVTLGLTITDQNRRAAYYNNELKDIVLKVVQQSARWQQKALSRFKLPTIIFVDEPGLYAYGQSTHITLKYNEIQYELDQIFESIITDGGIPGIHCCASTDWSILLGSKASIISFDAFEYFDKFAAYSKEINIFLEKGGYLAWGIVPTSEKISTTSPDSLAVMLNEQIKTLITKGVQAQLLREQSLITPSCGTGTLSPLMSEQVYRITNSLCHLLQS